MSIDRPTPGPYEFPTVPPYDLCGWKQELSRDVMPAFASAPDSPIMGYDEYIAHFADDRDSPDPRPIWEYAARTNGGLHLPCWYQKTGDCVSMGVVNCCDYRARYEIAGRYEEEATRFGFPPFIYGMSRCAPDLGNGRLGGGAGSTGAWGIGAICKYGMLFADDANVPTYSGDLADRWGRGSGPPREFWELAADNRMGKKAHLTDVAQIRRELCNHRPVTIACMWDWDMRPREYKGFHVFRRASRVGGHQTALLDWNDDIDAAYQLNSWGQNAHGSPLNGEPPGGAWTLADDLEYHLRSNYSEFYSMAIFEGPEGKIDFGVL